MIKNIPNKEIADIDDAINDNDTGITDIFLPPKRKSLDDAFPLLEKNIPMANEIPNIILKTM